MRCDVHIKCCLSVCGPLWRVKTATDSGSTEGCIKLWLGASSERPIRAPGGLAQTRWMKCRFVRRMEISCRKWHMGNFRYSFILLRHISEVKSHISEVNSNIHAPHTFNLTIDHDDVIHVIVETSKGHEWRMPLAILVLRLTSTRNATTRETTRQSKRKERYQK